MDLDIQFQFFPMTLSREPETKGHNPPPSFSEIFENIHKIPTPLSFERSGDGTYILASEGEYKQKRTLSEKQETLAETSSKKRKEDTPLSFRGETLPFFFFQVRSNLGLSTVSDKTLFVKQLLENAILNVSQTKDGNIYHFRFDSHEIPVEISIKNSHYGYTITIYSEGNLKNQLEENMEYLLRNLKERLSNKEIEVTFLELKDAPHFQDNGSGGDTQNKNREKEDEKEEMDVEDENIKIE